MQKVLVAEIGSETTVVNAFGDLNTENPRLLGQGISRTTLLDGDIGIGVKLAVSDLEKNIGPIGSLGEISFYAANSLPTLSASQEVNAFITKGGILSTPEAIMQAARLIYEEVGGVFVLDVGSSSTNVYSITSELAQRTVEENLGVTINATALVKIIGENLIKERHGQDWEKLLNSRPETPEEMALSAELAAAAVSITLQRHCGQLRNYKGKSGRASSVRGQGLRQIRWIVGTGMALTQSPNGLDIMREGVKGIDGVFPEEGIAMLLDKDCLIVSIGVLSSTFRQGAWQLLRESFGVES